MLAATMFLLAQAATPESSQRPGNLNEALFYASSEASGNRLCDRDRAARYAHRFEARYGKRIQALLRYHERRFGPDPDFVTLSSCMSTTRSSRWQDREHAKALKRFEATLRSLEVRYGPPTHPASDR